MGRQCATEVVIILRRFNLDTHLFYMALRVLGNITRLDENIVRVVAAGAITGIVKGLRTNFERADLVKLGADVISNLATVDERNIAAKEGIAILNTSVESIETKAKARGSAMEPDSKAALESIKSAASMVSPDVPGSLQVALNTMLVKGGAARCLLDVMQGDTRDEDLLIACLKALHYLGASKDLIGVMVRDLKSIESVLRVMRAFDYNMELLRRGARVLGAALEVDGAREVVMGSGAPQVLLSAIEAHRGAGEETSKLAVTCLSVLMLGQGPEIVAAAKEMQSVRTLVDVATQHIADPEFLTIVLSVLNGWTEDDKDILGSQVASNCTPLLGSLLEVNQEDQDMVAAVAQFVVTIAAVDAHGVVLAKIPRRLAGVIVDKAVHGATEDPNLAMVWRTAVGQLLHLLEQLVKDEELIPALVADSIPDYMQLIYTRYEEVHSEGEMFFDRATCEAAKNVVDSIRKHDSKVPPIKAIVDTGDGNSSAPAASQSDAPAADAASGTNGKPSLTTNPLLSGGAEGGPDGVRLLLSKLRSEGIAVVVWAEDAAPHKRMGKLKGM